MTLRHLKIFVSVYQQGSITKAAQRLHLAQPSVSLAIRELENYYGIKLFDRMSRRIYATENGKNFYSYALHIVSLFNQMETEVKDWDFVGSLRLGSSITIGNFLLPELVKRFRDQHPDTNIYVNIRNTADIEQYVMDNKVDFGLVEGHISMPQLNQIPFMKHRLSMICSTCHPLAKMEKVTFRDTLSYDFLLRETGSAGRDIVNSLLALYDMELTPAWESVSSQAIVKAVGMGIGISILPYLLVKKDIDDNRIREIVLSDINLERDFSIIYHKNKYLTPSALAFIQLSRNFQIDEENV